MNLEKDNTYRVKLPCGCLRGIYKYMGENTYGSHIFQAHDEGQTTIAHDMVDARVELSSVSEYKDFYDREDIHIENKSKWAQTQKDLM